MKRLMGGILLGVGALIAGTSGLCSVGFLVTMLVSAVTSSSSGTGLGLIGILPMIVIFGGIPFAIGFGLIQWGRSLLRESEQG